VNGGEFEKTLQQHLRNDRRLRITRRAAQSGPP